MEQLARAMNTKFAKWAPGLHVSSLSWSLAVSVVAQASTFAMSFLLARIIGRVAFGEWAAIQNTVGTVSGIAQLSMAVTATKFVAELVHTRPERVGRILGVCSTITLTTGLVSAGAIAISAPWFCRSVLQAPHLVQGVRISAISTLILTINGYQVGGLAGLERFRLLALAGAFGGIATALLVTVFALALGLDGALLGYALSAALTWSAFHVLLRAECRRAGIRVSYAGMRSEANVLGHFAIPASLAGFSWMLASWLSTLILVRRPSGYAEMAALSAAGSLRGAVLFAPLVITRVSAPVMASLAGAGAMERHDGALRGSVMLAGTSAAAAAALIAGGAPWLLSLFGRSFQGTSAVVVVTAVSAVFEAVGQALNQQFLSRGRMWWNLVMVTGRGAVLVVGTYVLVVSGGALGAAWATLLAHAAAVAFVLAFIARTKATPPAARAI
jgi:O-antigen/teichoic acid export membrane protein